MTELSFWIEAIAPYITKTVQSSAVLPYITAIRFLPHNQIPTRNTLYIGTPREAEKLLKLVPENQEITIFVSGSDEKLHLTAKKRKVNLICSTLDVLEIHERLSDRMHQSLVSLLQAQEDSTSGAGTGFETLLDDIVKNRLTNEAEINHRLSLLSKTPGRFLSFILLEFERPKGADFPDLFRRLESFFPDSNIAKYEDRVVILLNCSDRMSQPTPVFDDNGFHALLAECNAFAAISNATSHRFRLHTNYVLTDRIMKLGNALRTNTSQRIFYFEDYAEYYMIDLCFNSFNELFGHNDIIYLTHPDAIALARYDKMNNTNLLDVLYYYCLCSENISITAQAAYMHRNTVTAKIARIRKIIHANLNDGQIRQRMIFSYKILRYYEKYVGINIEERIIKRTEYDKMNDTE